MRVLSRQWLASLTLASICLSASCRRTTTPTPAASDAPTASPETSLSSSTPPASAVPSLSAPTAPPSATTQFPQPGDAPAPTTSTRPKDPRLSIPGPAPRDADAARQEIIDQVRPIVEACFHAARGKQTGQRGRLRVVMRFDKDMKVHSVDATSSGSLQRQVATCTQTRVAKTKFRTATDTPRFLSFPLVLPPR